MGMPARADSAQSMRFMFSPTVYSFTPEKSLPLRFSTTLSYMLEYLLYAGNAELGRSLLMVKRTLSGASFPARNASLKSADEMITLACPVSKLPHFAGVSSMLSVRSSPGCSASFLSEGFVTMEPSIKGVNDSVSPGHPLWVAFTV